MGGIAAALLFLAISLLSPAGGSTPDETQLRSVFGSLAVGINGYIGSAMTVVALALIIAVTARMTVRRTLTELD